MKKTTSKAAPKVAPKVALYVRVSTDEQTKGFGPQEQREKLELYCKFKGWDEITWFEDLGESGGNMERPGLKKLLRAVKKKEVYAVVVYKSDRLSRSLRDLLVLIEDYFEPQDVAFISATEEFSTNTASGKAFLSMLGTFAEFERNTITERMLGGRRQKAQKGGYAAGRPALGYSPKEGNLEIDSDAGTVRKIFELHHQGVGLRQIAKEMQNAGIPTKSGGDWHHSTVRYILRNAKYKGQWVHTFDRVAIEKPAPHLAVIPLTDNAK